MREPSVQGDRVGVEIAAKIAHLRSERGLPPFEVRCHAGRQGEIEDVGRHLVRATLPVNRVAGLPGGAHSALLTATNGVPFIAAQSIRSADGRRGESLAGIAL